jgi:steroid delta-isomerase
MDLDRLIRFYNDFSPASVARFAEFYSADAYFKDPFNEVRGIAAIERIFSHMFAQVAEPRFVVSETIGGANDDGNGQANGAMLVWEFRFCQKRGGRVQVIRGISHLRFDAGGKVCYHRDYWDAAEELYMKLPLIGPVMRALRKMLSA